MTSPTTHAHPARPHRLARILDTLHKNSLLPSWIPAPVRHALEDPLTVALLRNNPVALLFHNQRLLFSLLAYLSVLALWILCAVAPPTQDPSATLLLLSLASAVAIATAVTGRHALRGAIIRWSLRDQTNRVPRAFDALLLHDQAILLIVVAIGRLAGLPLDSFAFLIIGNALVYSALIGTGGRARLGGALLATAILLALGILITIPTATARFPDWFAITMHAGPLFAMTIMSSMSFAVITRLRTQELAHTVKLLDALSYSETRLALGADSIHADSAAYSSEAALWKRVRDVLNHALATPACAQYTSLSLWLLDSHQDLGPCACLGPRTTGFDSTATVVRLFREHLDISLANADTTQDSSRHVAQCITEAHGQPAAALRAGVWPVVFGRRAFAILLAMPRPQSEPHSHEHAAFFQALASIVASGYSQWLAQATYAAYEETDALLSETDLEAVFSKAAKILRRHLSAQACMILYRPSASERSVRMISTDGIAATAFEPQLAITPGQTAVCLEDGKTIRWDDVQAHRDQFAASHLATLETALGAPVTAWLGVPIGRGEHNRGVAKVFNRTFGKPWFSRKDQVLAEEVCIRLHAVAQHILRLEEATQARAQAEAHASTAARAATEAARAAAEAALIARRRQDDVMTLTHQLLGPLAAVVGAITSISHRSVEGRALRTLELAHALTEDAIALCYGTFTSFAVSLGKKTAFGRSQLDAANELRALALRLQRTADRHDLGISVRSDPDFPHIVTDRNLFTSVMYSLIHNAMKYSDAGSLIVFESGFERATHRPALKVKSMGIPILPHEVDLIFQKFGKGQLVEASGLRNEGVGLGLWVARELMRAIGGDLVVELAPQEPRLSVFVVTFPD